MKISLKLNHFHNNLQNSTGRHTPDACRALLVELALVRRAAIYIHPPPRQMSTSVHTGVLGRLDFHQVSKQSKRLSKCLRKAGSGRLDAI